MTSLIAKKNIRFNNQEYIYTKNQAGSFILVNLDNDTDAAHEIYGVAGRFFQQILDARPLSDEMRRIAAEYKISEKTVSENLENFLQDLFKLKVILSD